MLKMMLRIALFPVMLCARLVLCIAAFITSIAGSIIGLATSLFVVLSMVEFAIRYWQNGIAYAVLALLVSPIGLPGICNLLLDAVDHVLVFFEGLIA